MHGFVLLHNNSCKVKLYEEQPENNYCYNIVDSENENRLVLIHYSQTKIIPQRT